VGSVTSCRSGTIGKGARQRSESGRPKPPLSCPSGLYGLKRRRSIRHQAIDHPWRRTSGRGAEIRSQSDTGFIDSGRPALIAPPLSHKCDSRSVLDLLGDAFHDEIEALCRKAQRTPRVTTEIPPLPSVFSGLEPEGVIDPQCAYARDVRTAVLIDCRQPTGVPIGSASARGLGHPLRESVCDAVPVKEWKPVEVRKVLGFGRCSSRRRAGGHHCCHSARACAVGVSLRPGVPWRARYGKRERHLPPGARRCPTGVRTSSDHFLCLPCGGPSLARNSPKLRLSCCITPGQPAKRGSNIVSSPPQINPQVSGSRASLIAVGSKQLGIKLGSARPKTPLGFCRNPNPVLSADLAGQAERACPAGWGARRRLSRAVPRCTPSHRGGAGRSRRGRRRRVCAPDGGDPREWRGMWLTYSFRTRAKTPPL